MSILDLTLLPIRSARHIADAVVHPSSPGPTPPAELVVVEGMPEGVPPGRGGPSPSFPFRRNGRSARSFRALAARVGWADRGGVARTSPHHDGRVTPANASMLMSELWS